MARIRSLIPKVTRNEAIEQFSPGGILSQFREVAFGPLRSLAEFYIPFRLYRVRIVNRGREEQRVFGLDAVTGSLDLYQFQELPGRESIVYLETRNCPEALLEEAQAQALLTTKVLGWILGAGSAGTVCGDRWSAAAGGRGQGTRFAEDVADGGAGRKQVGIRAVILPAIRQGRAVSCWPISGLLSGSCLSTFVTPICV